MQFVRPQLVPDGRKGFFIGYMQNIFCCFGAIGANNLIIAGYRPSGGVLQQYFTVQVDPDLRQGYAGPSGCVAERLVWNRTDEFVQAYYLYPDGYDGCAVIWSFTKNAAPPTGGMFIAYNRFFRARANAAATTLRRTNGTLAISDPSAATLTTKYYTKDEVYPLYRSLTYHYSVICLPFVVPMEVVENGGEGYLLLESRSGSGLNIIHFLRAAALQTNANINIQIAAFTVQDLLVNTNSPSYTKVHYLEPLERFDSIPYQLCSDLAHPYVAYNPVMPSNLKKVNRGIDTLFGIGNATSVSYSGMNLAGGGNRFIATALAQHPVHNNNSRTVLLQEVAVTAPTSDSFSLRINTNQPNGKAIGLERSTGFQSNSVFFDNPFVSMDENGNALFSVRELWRYVRVSPVGDSGRLVWGTMGKPLGARIVTPDLPYAVMGSRGEAVVAWHDYRNFASTDYDIYMRRVDSVIAYSSLPPFKKLQALPNFVNSSQPFQLLGLSQNWMDADMLTPNSTTTVVQLRDNKNLGFVNVQAYEHPGNIRLHNGKPYLSRNYLINTTNAPSGSVGVRVFFTEAQFNQLKAADPSILSPANLVVIKQPSTSNVPEVYAPVAGEETIYPSTWMSVDGGYYLELNVNSFSNFFITQGNSPLPVRWLTVNARRLNERSASVSWTVAEQLNVKNYTVQQSSNGSSFQDVCEVAATSTTAYQCAVPVGADVQTFFRVKQTDLDGRTSYSNTVRLEAIATQQAVFVYPNPATDFITIESKEAVRQLAIVDAVGRVVLRRYAPALILTINTSGWGKGSYLIVTENKKGVQTKTKLLLQ